MEQTQPKIIVVDDDQNLLTLLVDTLKAIGGYRVTGYLSGQEVLDALEQEPFDLLISDIKMPGIDGIALLEKVRHKYPDLPVLFISGVDAPEIIGRAVPNGFLAKPFRINHIEEQIENCLKKVPPKSSSTLNKILIVDDNETFRKMLHELLKHHQYQPTSVSSGEEALEFLKENKTDIVITDVKMPVMDGLELLGEIKKIDAQLPVVLVTAYLEDETINDHIKDTKHYQYLPKPFRVEDILELLNTLSN